MKSQSLTHPAALAALLILLLNDHLLRRYFPSTLTGKVGDFAWLFFAALATAWLLKRLLPAGGAKSRDWIAATGFAIVALGFTLGKTQPIFHVWIGSAFKAITGRPSVMRLDPTDLVALIALLPAWLVWKARSNSLPRPRLATWLALSFFSLLTIANMAQPDYGIDDLEIRSHYIMAGTSYFCYASYDGGLSWSSISLEKCLGDRLCATPNFAPSENGAKCDWAQVTQVLLSDPQTPNNIWRYNSSGLIEASHDGGSSWSTDYTPVFFNQVEEIYYQRTRLGNIDVSHTGPFDVVFDEKSGNIIFGMGHQGILVRTPASTWITVGVGPYQPVREIGFDQAISLIVDELFLSLALSLLVISGLSCIGVHGRLARFFLIFVVLGAMIWLGNVIFLPPALSFNYTDALSTPLTILTIICAVLLVPFALYRLYTRSAPEMWQALVIALATGLLFSAPYVLWVFNIIPSYSISMVLALVLAGASLLVGIYFQKKKFGK